MVGVGHPLSIKLLIVHFPQPHPNAFSCNSSENMPLLLELPFTLDNLPDPLSKGLVHSMLAQSL